MNCFDFRRDGNEATIDIARMMKIVTECWLSFLDRDLEYEGRLTELEGIQAAKRLLDRLM